jgi:hypothetical protein
MPITLTDDLAELKAQAEGAKPFTPNALLDHLAGLPWPKLQKLPPAERLAIGYYTCAQRRAEQMGATPKG